MKSRLAVKISGFLIAIALVIFICRSQFHLLYHDVLLGNEQKKILIENAATSLQTLDVPVGALLLYNDSILATGYNTVYRDSNVSGHAEINAINNAVRKIGFKNFSKLNREKLILVSTFEPCMMCRGALIENNIRQIYFLKGKGFYHWLKNDAKQFRYEWNKRKAEGEESQDSLFMLHPDYPKR